MKEFSTHIGEQIYMDTPKEPKLGISCLLPEIHKPGNPGRPVVWDIGTITVGVSGHTYGAYS